MTEPRLSVHYLHERDQLYEFPTEGTGYLFGRDEARCEIVIWSALLKTSLSRVAGRIWRREGELWVRNLSYSHDLRVEVPGSPPLSPLPPRHDPDYDPGAAQAIPGELAYVSGPDGCTLVVAQQRLPLAEPPPEEVGEPTSRMPALPDSLRPIAVALCEPLLRGRQMPASYEEVQRRLGISSKRRIRDLVAQLCTLYLNELPELRSRVEARRRLEEKELGLPAAPMMLRRGVWVFGWSASRESRAESAEIAERRENALPTYYEVAHLLVRRRAVTARDSEALPEPPPPGPDPKPGG
jgi:hypothetical protein